jgi:cellobiose-specific phosphotransferase system component IIB
MAFELSGYVDVATRLRMALKDWPQLRIQETNCTLEQVGEQLFLICVVTVWRDERDAVPVIASAAEQVPGRTPYTRNAERMVGFTSALGRALGYMGYGIDKAIASADEVHHRKEEDERPISDRQRFANARSNQIVEEQRAKRTVANADAPATAPQMKMVKMQATKAGIATDEDLALVCAETLGDGVMVSKLTKGQASTLIEELLKRVADKQNEHREIEEPF